MSVFTLDDIQPTRWANGQGYTRVIAASPASGSFEELHWRVSAATIVEDGPFSILPGVQRSIALVEGKGLHMHFAHGAPHDLLDSTPFDFSGDERIHATLVASDSKCLDFNVMTRSAMGCRHSLRHLPCAPQDAISLLIAPDHICICIFAVLGEVHCTPPGVVLNRLQGLVLSTQDIGYHAISIATLSTNPAAVLVAEIRSGGP
jgi:environmental stress-induced protein Ves